MATDSTNPIEETMRRLEPEFSRDLSERDIKRFEDAPVCVGKYLDKPQSMLQLMERDPQFVQEMIDDKGYILFRARIQAYLRTDRGARFRDKFTFSAYSRKESSNVSSITQEDGELGNRSTTKPGTDDNQTNNRPD